MRSPLVLSRDDDFCKSLRGNSIRENDIITTNQPLLTMQFINKTNKNNIRVIHTLNKLKDDNKISYTNSFKRKSIINFNNLDLNNYKLFDRDLLLYYILS